MEIAPIPKLEMTPVHMSAKEFKDEIEVADKPIKTFGEVLTDALKKTNELQLESDKMNAALAAGRIEDVSQVIVASQKADISIQLALQLRNRAVSAYQEVMRMQV